MTRRYLPLLGLPALLLFYAFLFAGPPASAAPRGPTVRIRTLEDGLLKGSLVGLDAKGLRLREAGGSQERTLPLASVIDLDFSAGRRAAAKKVPRTAGGEEIRLRAYLIGGEILAGVFRAPSEEGIQLEVEGLGLLDVSFDVMLSLEQLPANAGPCPDLQGQYPRPKSGDLAYDSKDDEFAGGVYEATEKGLVMEDAHGRRNLISWKRLRLVYLENDRLAPAKDLLAEVELSHGSRIPTGSAVTTTDSGLRFSLRSLPEKSWRVPFRFVETVRWSGGAFVYASDLPYEGVYRKYHEDPPALRTPAFNKAFFGARRDRRPRGCPLRLGGQTYRHGFGVFSHSTITLQLNGDYSSFRSGFGIDDQVLSATQAGGKRGNVEARVLGDGKVLWKASDVRAGQPMLQVGPVDVSGVKLLVLEVGFGKEMHLLDEADWVDPILVRK